MKPMKCPKCGCDLTDDAEDISENGEGAPNDPMDKGEDAYLESGTDPLADDIAKAVVAQMKQNNIKGPKGS